MKLIHKSGLDGKTICGETGAISSSGVSAFITCQKCKELMSKPSWKCDDRGYYLVDGQGRKWYSDRKPTTLIGHS